MKYDTFEKYMEAKEKYVKLPKRFKLSEKAYRELYALELKLEKESCSKCPFYNECNLFECKIKLR